MVYGRGMIFLVAGVLSILALATLAHTLTVALDHNEHAYVGVATLLDGHRLYHDVLFNQMPYSVYLYDGLYRITGADNLLLAARLVNWLLMLVSMGLFFVLAHRYAGSLALALAVTVFYTVNPIMMGPMKEASSYMIPMAASLGAVLLCRRALGGATPHPLAAFGTGALLGIALGAKLYYFALFPVFVCTALLYPCAPGFRDRLIRGALPIVAGWLVALLPVWAAAVRGPDMFWFNNYVYHMYDPLYFGPDGIPLAEKVKYIRRTVGIQQNIAFIAVFGMAVLLLARRVRTFDVSLIRTLRYDEFLLLGCAAAASAASASPNPVWIQHFAFPLPFILLGFTLLYRRMDEAGRLPVRLAWAPTILVALLYEGMWLFIPISRLHQPETWTVNRIHQTAQTVRAEIERAGLDGPVATLSPLYAVEARLPIYPELGMGPFLYRTAEYLPVERQETLPIVSPHTVTRLLETRPPAAIVTGEEGELDAPFEAYAAEHGYEKRPLPLDHLTLYIRPSP